MKDSDPAMSKREPFDLKAWRKRADRPADALTLREARQALGESQSVFCKRFGVSQSALAKWELDGIHHTASQKIARMVLASPVIQDAVREHRRRQQSEAA